MACRQRLRSDLADDEDNDGDCKRRYPGAPSFPQQGDEQGGCDRSAEDVDQVVGYEKR